ncbi:MAG TPA: hypothetical protein VK174_18545 [Chitinophagales bacterium]|nr:hypothetical protein [Chitinophagales bacterium]HLP51260.1 hypothetical protein [Chitinophagales bacterium]
MKSSSKFLITIFVITALCAVAQVLWNMNAPEAYRYTNGYVLLGIFSLSITAIHLFLMRAAEGKPQAFVGKYMASTVFKFMFYMMLLVVLLLFTEGDKKILILHFLFYYAIFTVVEVGFLYTELQKMKK